MGPEVRHLHLASRDHAASQHFYETYFGFRFDSVFPRGGDPDGHVVQVYFDPHAA